MERVNLEKVYSTFSEFSSVPFKYITLIESFVSLFKFFSFLTF